MTQNLNLDRLIEGDSTLRVDEDRDNEIAERLVKLLFYKERKRGIFERFCRLIGETYVPLPCKPRIVNENQIRDILVDNGLVAEGGDPNKAVEELLDHRLFSSSTKYSIIRLRDGYDNTFYELREKERGREEFALSWHDFIAERD